MKTQEALPEPQMGLLSPSRLNDFLACPHMETLRLAGVAKDELDPTIKLVSAKGIGHEEEVLNTLEAATPGGVRIPTNGTIEERVAATRAAIAADAPLIHQAALVGARWLGYPDFLVRRETDAGVIYEPHDAKLSSRLKPSHALQLAVYADLLAESGLPRPTEGRILLGGRARTEGRGDAIVRLDQIAHVAARLKARYEQFIANGAPGTRPLPCAACARCSYAKRCRAEWTAADAVHLVPGLTSGQREKLETKDVSTVSALASTGLSARDFGIGEDSYARLKRQAELNVRWRMTGTRVVELRQVVKGRGFARLPPAAPGDLFYDIEGDPMFEGGRLEYLHGIWGALNGREARYTCWWAHDREQEKAAFEDLVDALTQHFTRFPDARLYHYAPYERTALRRLAMLHATREAEVDNFLIDERLVDLYAVVRQGLMVSTDSYSIKALEDLYGIGRDEAVVAGGDSIVAYETWRETGDETLLASLAAYNEKDVISTAALRDWLIGLRPAGCVYDPVTEDAENRSKRAAEREAQEASLRELAGAVRATDCLKPHARETLAELIWFHQRADKPAWWALFDRRDADETALTDDLDAITGLVPVGPPVPEKRSHVQSFWYPPQETKLKVGDDVVVTSTLAKAGSIFELDRQAALVSLKGTDQARQAWAPGLTIGAGKPLDSNKLKQGVQATARLVASGSRQQISAFLDLLERNPPRLEGYKPGEPIARPGHDLVEEAKRALAAMNDTCLFIQGPPGAGKTHTVGHAIVSLLAAGKRIVISSNSHKAINNLLTKVENVAEAEGVRFNGVKKASEQSADSFHQGPFVRSVTSSGDIGEPDLLAATAFELCNCDGGFDHLVIDEAGQVSLGHLAAMARCAKNIVLVGDQMQLPQPVQGHHPGETGLSLLDYLLQGEATVAPGFGILLNVSWRMHPSLCNFISTAIYDGRLTAHPQNGSRVLRLEHDADPSLAPAGLQFVPVTHVGNTQESPEEADRIASLVQSLLDQSWVDETGGAKELTLNDILIVAPYNLQVQCLQAVLPEGARVGTVDKFQGQEAPVSIVSLATSSPQDAPRGTGFLLNRQRLNVALSRAKSLAILVASPALADWAANSLEDLRLIDLLVQAMEGCVT